MSGNAIEERERLLNVIRDRNSVWKQFALTKDRIKGYGDGYIAGFHDATILILAYLGRDDLSLDIFGEIAEQEEE